MESSKLAPIVLFIYNRPEHTKQTLEFLSANTLSKDSDLFIYADGAKDGATAGMIAKIKQTRDIAYLKKWCKTVTVIEAEKNKGLAASIILGVTEVIKKYGKCIVLEDDIVTGKYFLEYMNTALETYSDEKQIFHITGWRNPVKNRHRGASYLYPIMDCWSWATWSDRWEHFKKDCTFYKSIFTDDMKYRFNRDGTDLGQWEQIELNATGKINTWAIFWGATVFTHNGLCLAPTQSLVRNIGMDGSGEHCGKDSLLKDENIDFAITDFPKKPFIVNEKEYEQDKQFFLKRKKIADTKALIKKFIKPIYSILKLKSRKR